MTDYSLQDMDPLAGVPKRVVVGLVAASQVPPGFDGGPSATKFGDLIDDGPYNESWTEMAIDGGAP